jgi:hypothetical protein
MRDDSNRQHKVADRKHQQRPNHAIRLRDLGVNFP